MELKIQSQPIEQAEKFSVAHVNWNLDQYTPEVYAQVVYDETGFDVKFVIKESDPQTNWKNHLDPVCRDSCVEFFINFDPEHSDKYINFEVNAIGVMNVALRSDRYNYEHFSMEDIESLHITPVIEAEQWSVSYHVGLPLLQKKYPGFKMENCTYVKANMYKCGDDRRPKHYLSLFPVGTEGPDFHRPEYFGVIRLV